MDRDQNEQGREGYIRLEHIAARLKSSKREEVVILRELLRWFGAEYRGGSINNLIKDALFQNNLRIEPSINEQSIDGLIKFHEGVEIDEVEQEFLTNYRELHAGSKLNEIEAAFLSKLHREYVADVLAGWIDRNPEVSKSQILSKFNELYVLDFEGLNKEEAANIIAFPEVSIRIGLLPDTSFLNAIYERRIKPFEFERKNRERLYRSIGQFMFEFSQLEFIIRHALAKALNLSGDKFYTITSTYDFSALCRVTQNIYLGTSDCTDADSKEIKKIFDQTLKCNDERNRIAHGTWFMGEEKMGTQHVSRNTLKPHIFYQSIEGIDKATSEAANSRAQLVKFLTSRNLPDSR